MKTMASKSIWNLAFLTLFALSPPHQSSAAASRGRFLLNPGAPPPEGLCSATVKKHGYKCKEFHVTTGDGYILSLNRIPEGRTGGGKRRRPPVLLQHGVLLDGMAWLAGPPKQSLAMLLADKGFDVWISNLRGTRFSRRHTRLDPIDPKFWNWTWDDLASQDLPSIIGFIFKKTGSKIHYVGHSMGTLIALASLSEGKLKNIKSAALLSPIAHLSHIESDIVVLAAKSFLGEWGRMFGLAEFDPIGQNEAAFLKDICEYYKVDCDQMKITALTGENCCLNGSTFNDIITKVPQPTATKNLVHFSQTIRFGKLSKYDYANPEENMKHYGEINPPVYNLSKIRRDLPLFIGSGGEDVMSDIKDVGILLDDLKNHHKKKLKVVFIHKYAHLDFLLATNANQLIYNQIIDFFKKHDK